MVGVLTIFFVRGLDVLKAVTYGIEVTHIGRRVQKARLNG